MSNQEKLSTLDHRLGGREAVVRFTSERVASAIGVFEQDITTLVGGDWTHVTRAPALMRVPPPKDKYLFVMPDGLALETDESRRGVNRLIVFCSDKRFATDTYKKLSGGQPGKDAFIVVPGGAVQPRASVNNGASRQEALSTLIEYSLGQLPEVSEILLLGHLDTCAAVKVHMLGGTPLSDVAARGLARQIEPQLSPSVIFEGVPGDVKGELVLTSVLMQDARREIIPSTYNGNVRTGAVMVTDGTLGIFEIPNLGDLTPVTDSGFGVARRVVMQ